ncbi:hypothetical protein [Enterococcus sp. 5H]|uniref:hypothetical protein n=1 Tax=Enterococcus sp. 5H TaxID=1229490 RepID=UPI0023024FB7|nr:hypothetical protein [Enterococcus sp. 5H]MDA9470515.1 hypothetical protein [Enterococcus sp. 5H]
MIPEINKSFSNSADIKQEVVDRFQSEKARFFRKKKLKKKLIVSVVVAFSSIVLLLMALENKQFRTFAERVPILDKIIETIIDEDSIEEGIEVYVFLPEIQPDINNKIS